MRMRMATMAASVFVLILTVGCVSVRPSDQRILQQAEAAGQPAVPENAKVKNAVAAGALNILPGFGNFYLGIGTEQSGQWGIGAANLLLWPASVVWGIPEAAIDAGRINKIAAAEYYRDHPQ